LKIEEALGHKRLVSFVKGNLPKGMARGFLTTLEPIGELKAKELLKAFGEDPAPWESFESFCRTSVEVQTEVELKGIIKDFEKTEKEKCSDWIIQQVKATPGILGGILKKRAKDQGVKDQGGENRGWSGGTWTEGLKAAIASGQIKMVGKGKKTTYQPTQP